MSTGIAGVGRHFFLRNAGLVIRMIDQAFVSDYLRIPASCFFG